VLIASQAALTCTAAAVFDALMSGAAEWGLPERTLSDNAQAHHALHEPLNTLGIATRHSSPYHPQTCGKVERFHQTLKRWLAARDPAATLEELQRLLDEFRAFYNHRRRHRSGLLQVRLTSLSWDVVPREGCSDAQEVPAGVQA
jgi:transposase InsO family protein